MSHHVEKKEISTLEHSGETGSNVDIDVDTHKSRDVLQASQMTDNERSEALAIAEAADPGVNYRSRRGVTLILILLSCLVCGSDTAFDGGVMSSINSMKPFLEYFHLQQAEKSTGIIFGLYTVGGVCAFFLNFVLPDLLGRRKAMGVGNLILVLGILLVSLSRNLGMFLVGRFCQGVGAVSASAAARAYIVEIAPTPHRGKFLGFYNVMYQVGAILVSGSAIGFGKYTNEWGWRGIVMLGLYGPVINIVALPFIPESPRWLFARGRIEQATVILAKYHTRHNDRESPLLKLELQELEMAMEVTGSASADKWWDLRKLFNTRPNRYRMGLGAMIGVWGQTLGPSTAYFAVLLKVAGINDLARQRVLNFVNTVLQMLAGAVGAVLTDRIGRRPLTIFGTASAAIGMFIIGGLLSHQKHKTFATAGISFIYLFGVFSQVAWTPINNLYAPEIMTFDIRAKGLAFQQLTTQCAGLINTFGVPAALVALNYKLYFIFGAWDIIGLITIYWFMAETKGVTLEQMEDIFVATNPRQKAAELVRLREARGKEIRAEQLADA